MEEVIEFEATPDIVPALDLGKKKKKKKKKAVEDGETPRESLANAAPEVEFLDDAPPPPLDLGLKKKKKKKKATDILNEGSYIDASDVFGKEQPSQESNESLIRSAFSSLEPDDGDNEHDENENAQEAERVTEARKHESSSVQTDDVDILGASNEVEQFGEPRRPMTAAEKKKAKKEREKAAKKKKAAEKDKDIDVVFAELGDAQDASAEQTSGLASSSRSSIVQTELSNIDQRPVAADEVDGLLDELEASVPAKSGAQKKKNKKKKKAVQAKDDADALLAEFDAPPHPSQPLIDEVSTTLGALNVGDEPGDIASAEKKVGDLLAELGDDNDASKMSAAQKKKAKKKKKASALKADPAAESENPEEASEPAGDSKKTKKKKESAAVRRMREQLEKQKAEEDRLRKIREEEEARIAEEERLKKEAEEKKAQEKARKKAAEKARRERKRQEGTLLTKAEKERRRKAEHFKQQLMAQGRVPMAASTVLTGNVAANGGPISVSGDGEQQNQKRITYGSRRRRKVGPTVSSTAEVAYNEHLKEAPPEIVEEVPVESPTAKEVPAMEEHAEEEPAKSEPAKVYVSVPAIVPDAWDAISEDSSEDADTEGAKDEIKRGEVPESAPSRNSLIGTGEESASGESESEDSDDSEDEDDYEGMSKTEIAAEKRREAVRRAHEKQRQKAWEARSPDHLRSPIICILGHVDTGKTKILDRIRRTNVQDGEAGGITQQIGATYFPIDAVRKEAVKLVEGRTLSYNVPSLLIIDTPGHESFTNLRTRGSSLCDIAILVVDIMHGLEPQTKESIGLLKLRKTPFIVALNKIDRIYDWNAQPNNCPTRDALAKQKAHAQQEFNMRVRETKMQFMEEGFNTELYWDNDDPRKTISLVPTSAITGEGIPDLLMLLLALPQKLLVERLMFNTILEATVLEVKVIEGLGTTIDIVLTGGTICEGDTIVVLGLDGPIVTTIRALLTPHPMKEMRVKGQYLHHKEIRAAQGIKISADGLEKAVAGTQLVVAADPDDDDELEYAKEEVMKDFTTILKSVDKSGIGVYVQASTLGSLEALLEFLRTSKIPVSGINIGPVHKKDIVKASTMLERRKEYATVLAFDVKVEPEAKELAEENGVQIFTADIIYHLFDQFTAYMEDVKRRRREEVSDDVVFPSICNILPQHVYNKKDPIIVGVDVLEGILRVGTPLVVQHGDGWLDIGRVAGIELNKKQVRIAKKGESVAVKIQHKSTENIMYGRHFDFKDKLVSKMSRRAIDLLKQNFREDLGKEDWILVLKLKKMFNIL